MADPDGSDLNQIELANIGRWSFQHKRCFHPCPCANNDFELSFQDILDGEHLAVCRICAGLLWVNFGAIQPYQLADMIREIAADHGWEEEEEEEEEEEVQDGPNVQNEPNEQDAANVQDGPNEHDGKDRQDIADYRDVNSDRSEDDSEIGNGGQRRQHISWGGNSNRGGNGSQAGGNDDLDVDQIARLLSGFT